MYTRIHNGFSGGGGGSRNPYKFSSQLRSQQGQGPPPATSYLPTSHHVKWPRCYSTFDSHMTTFLLHSTLEKVALDAWWFMKIWVSQIISLLYDQFKLTSPYIFAVWVLPIHFIVLYIMQIFLKDKCYDYYALQDFSLEPVKSEGCAFWIVNPMRTTNWLVKMNILSHSDTIRKSVRN